MQTRSIVSIAVLLLFAAISSPVFAHGSAEKTSTSQKTSSASQQTLTYWTPLTTNADKRIFDKLIAEFEKTHSSIKLKGEYISHAAWTKRWMTAMASNGAPNLVICSQNSISWLHSQNQLVPVNQIIKQIDPSGTNFVKSRADLGVVTTADGKTWGIPYVVNINEIWYRKDLLAKAGIDPNKIRTWSDLYQAAKRASNPPNVYGMGMALGRGLPAEQQLFIWTEADGGNLFSPKTGAYLGGNPETKVKMIHAMEFLKKMYTNHILPPGVGTWKWSNFRTGMAQGQLLFTSSWGGGVGVAENSNPSMLKNMAVMAHPIGPDTNSYPSYSDAGSWNWGVVKNSSKATLAADSTWLRFFFQPDNVALATTSRPVYNLPVMKNVLDSKVFRNNATTAEFLPEIDYLVKKVLPTARRAGFEAGPTGVGGVLYTESFPSDALQHYMFGNWSVQKAYTYFNTHMKKMLKRLNYPLAGPYASNS